MTSARITSRLFTLITASLLCSLTTTPALSSDVITRELTPAQTEILKERKAALLSWKGYYRDNHFLSDISNALTAIATEQKKYSEYRPIPGIVIGESMRRFYNKVLAPTSGTEGRADLLVRFNDGLGALNDPETLEKKEEALKLFSEDIVAFFHTLYPLITDAKAKMEVAKNLYAARTLFDISTHLLAYLHITQSSETNKNNSIKAKKTEFALKKNAWTEQNNQKKAEIEEEKATFEKETAGALPLNINKEKARVFAVKLRVLDMAAKEHLGEGDSKGKFDQELDAEIAKIEAESRDIPTKFDMLINEYGSGWKKTFGLSGREKINCDLFEAQIQANPLILFSARLQVLDAMLRTMQPDNPAYSVFQAIQSPTEEVGRKYLALFGVLDIEKSELEEAVLIVEKNRILEESRAAKAAAATVELARTTLGEPVAPQSPSTASLEKKKTGGATNSTTANPHTVKRPAPRVKRRP